MNKQELPKALYVPSVQIPGRGTIEAQLRDDEGAIHIPVWGDEAQAINWVREGGMELWSQKDDAMRAKLSMGGEIVVRKVGTSEYFMILSLTGQGSKRYLDMAPDIGRLFAPLERQISVA